MTRFGFIQWNGALAGNTVKGSVESFATTTTWLFVTFPFGVSVWLMMWCLSFCILSSVEQFKWIWKQCLSNKVFVSDQFIFFLFWWKRWQEPNKWLIILPESQAERPKYRKTQTHIMFVIVMLSGYTVFTFSSVYIVCKCKIRILFSAISDRISNRPYFHLVSSGCAVVFAENVICKNNKIIWISPFELCGPEIKIAAVE